MNQLNEAEKDLILDKNAPEGGTSIFAKRKEGGEAQAGRKCNICKQEAEVLYQLPFRDLQGSDQEEYVQKICLCKKCGFLFTQNPLTEEQLANRYKTFSKFEFDADDYLLNESEDYKKRSQRQKFFIESVIKDDFNSVLEVGAASGYNLSLYREGKDVYGIEPSARNCRLAKKHYNVEMFDGMFSEYVNQNETRGEEKRKYDLIFLSHVLEHIVDPFDFILECKSMCSQYVFIEVPTMDYKYLEEPMGMFCEEHVNYFTLEGLNALMTAAGFEMVDVNYIFCREAFLPAGFPAMSTIWRMSKGEKNDFRPVFSTELIAKTYVEQNEKEFRKIREKIDAIPKDERLAVWGTGHHASMLLANTSLGEKNIVRVYDGDKRKARYTFAGHKIECFHEDDVLNGQIDAILIATYTAQKAISRLVEPYKEHCRIYYLYDFI